MVRKISEKSLLKKMSLKSSTKGLGSRGIASKKKTSAPDEITTQRDGKIKVKAAGYMAKLHHARTRPLDITPEAGQPSTGILELHHSFPPTSTTRRYCDASVVPLDRNDHLWVENTPAEERNLARLFGVWSAFSFWCHQTDTDPQSPDAGQKFLAWAITNLERECTSTVAS